ncbi:MAG TPA: amino acid deaminase/aldolase [Thermoleophilaceae bacterium]|nr:amino acid deaminase/aldolase [Thermoleophilaceae bacterium]
METSVASGPRALPASGPDEQLERLEHAAEGLEAPFACIDLDSLWANAADLAGRARPKPLRLASKSVRCRSLQAALLERAESFRGTLCFTLPEALWLAEHGFDDLLVAYPSADRSALRALAERRAEHPEERITVMVDSTAHLDLIEAAAGRPGAPIRVCLDVDMSLHVLGGRLRFGARRSPVRTPDEAAVLAREIAARPGLELAGVMGYEAQIAGIPDRPRGRSALGLAIRALKRVSRREIAARRAATVAAVREVAPLELVNGGGTGSLETTAREHAVTEVTAGSGLYGPALFDGYTRFRARPAAVFALPVVRRPSATVVTALGGGYLASGSGDRDRLPRPHLPPGLRLDPREGAGEVQTPLLGEPAERLAVGDRAWLRHAKAGELCERFNSLHLVEGDRVVDEVPTYRGEGQCFL